MKDPLHGVTLKALLQTLIDRHGWEELGRRVPIRCFQNEPSLKSSLKFLRKTPWARAKVEAIYVRELRQAERKRKRNQQRAARRAFSASMPVERPETLAFFWPEDHAAPTAEVAPGYRLEIGLDREAFCAVQQAIGFEVTDEIWAELQLVPAGMVVVHDEEGPVATACAVERPEQWTELGWVAVAPAHRGRGLGRVVSAAVVRQLLDGGHTRIFGSTQDERLAALRIYLDLGFRPVERPEKADRWHALLEILASDP